MLSKLEQLITDLGWAVALCYGLDRAFAAVCGCLALTPYLLVAQPIPKRRLLSGKRGRSIAVREVDAADLTDCEMPLTPELLAARRSRGAKCFGVFEDGRLIGFHCLALGPHEDEAVRARFVPEPAGESAWDFDIFLLPEKRVGLSFIRLWDEIFDYLRQQNIHWSMSYISRYNTGSLKSHQRLGAIAVARLVAVKAGSWQAFVMNVSPFLLISTGPRSRPVIRVPAPA